jgi:hypothetical protein
MRLQETWLTADPQAVRSAREAVRSFLAEANASTRADAELLTAEVIGNTLNHAREGGRVRLRIRRSEGLLRVEVLDPSPLSFSVLSEHDSEEAAIVVRLLDAFSTSWGQDRDPQGGRVLWFELTGPQRLRLPDPSHTGALAT